VQLRRIDPLQTHRDVVAADHRPPALAHHARIVEDVRDAEIAAVLGEGEGVVPDRDLDFRGIRIGRAIRPELRNGDGAAHLQYTHDMSPKSVK
jgi:hypothetical protein